MTFIIYINNNKNSYILLMKMKVRGNDIRNSKSRTISLQSSNLQHKEYTIYTAVRSNQQGQSVDPHVHTVHRLMLIKGAKRTIFYHITLTLQYCWDKTIARNGDMNRDDSGILTLVIKCFGITDTSEQNFAIRISSLKAVPKCLRKRNFF